jgi:cell division protein FtsL
LQKRQVESIGKEVVVLLKKYAIAIFAPMLILVMVVNIQAKTVSVRYELENLRSEISQLELQKESFEEVIAGMKSPERLLCRARELGMSFQLPVVDTPRLAMGGQEDRVTEP